MTVTRANFDSALATLVTIEPDPASINSMKDYDAFMAPHAATIQEAKAIIRDYGTSIAHLGLSLMQAERQSAMAQQTNGVAQSLVGATVNQVWDGCGPWKS